MAGDEFYLYLKDNQKNLLEELYLGKLRYYTNQFSLANYRWKSDNGLYTIEERMSDGKEKYVIICKEIIDQIRNSLLDKPITNDETSAYEDTLYALNWIDANLQKYQEQYTFSSNLDPGTMHIVFYIDIDL